PLASYTPLVRYSAVAAHLLLYGILFAILISGYLISTAEGKPIDVFGVLPVPAVFAGLGEQADLAGDIHLWLAWSVVILSVIHGLAALKHHFIDRDITLKRMLGHRID
ncbi:MAG TPA: cytochrome b, partial [Erwinia persicina]|nr:cytochrome b [Erwinia persicina]